MTATAARPPLRLAAGGAGAHLDWALWGLLAVLALFAVSAVADLVAVLGVLAQLPVPPIDRLDAGQTAGTVETVLCYGHLFAVGAWFVLAGRLLRRLGADPNPVLRTTPIVLWRIGIAATVAAAVALPRATVFEPGAFATRLHWMIPILVARLALTALVMAALFGVRRRVHEVLLASGVPPRPDPRRDTGPSLRAAPLTPFPARPVTVADDAWWAEVAARASAAGEPLPLLESWGATRRRWLLVAPSADLAALRATLLPGATVTLFGPPGDGPGALGLIEEPGSGTLRFDRIDTPEQLAAWHRRAADAPRSARYALDDPAALSATVPN
ncbi:hypothetical protein KZZ52_25415 [Dactylosporangium sp. AC04546]|uniref:hypothetical protein n=1 Tax=Dactylosporangium sp. AC04546 TaxID=2862460 RepID=UPI001EDF5BA8|nr:hypothetical protein [Dactylosporangium sp. AC04546]WVK88611.1 hypothetical protein KZZ52_25415 [Dactylosporangium sp. AC04546]